VDIQNLIASRRTIRQFSPTPISRDRLKILVDAGRLAPSAANLQPLEFIAVENREVRDRIFPCLRWAAYIHPAGDPRPGQEPSAYVIVLVNTKIREKMYEYDVGAAVENMALSAWGEGIASCWLISVDKPKIQSILEIPEHVRVDSVLALGYPAETSVVEDFQDSPRYWKDEQGTFHVPKRPLTSVLHFNRY
jgi:nitroreductase